MAILRFIVAEKLEEFNFEFDVKIDPLISKYGDLDKEQHELLVPNNWRISKVDWGDGSTTLENKHTFTQTGTFRVKMNVTTSNEVLDMSWSNITKFYKIPGILNSQAVGGVVPNVIKLVSNKIPPGGLMELMNALLEKFPDNVDPLSYTKNKFILDANGQVGYFSRTARTGKSGGQTYNPSSPIYIPESTLLASRRTQEELDKGWELVDKGWRVMMAVDDIYTVVMPKSVDDYLADEQGNQRHGYRNLAVMPFFNQTDNTLHGRAMKIMDHRYGSYARDERDSTLDGRGNRKSTIVPQKLYVVWEFQKPGESTWGHAIPIELTPVPAEGDTVTKIPAGLFTGTYKIAKPIVLDRAQFPTGTKVRSKWYSKWEVKAPDYGIKPTLRVTEGLQDNESLILTLP